MTIKITSQTVKVFDDEASAPGYHFEYYGVMAGDAANDTIDGAGQPAYDHLFLNGGDGDDVIIGNNSLETYIDGGNGKDLLYSLQLTSWVHFNGGAGVDTLNFVRTPAQYNDDAGVIADLAAGTAALIRDWISPYQIATLANVENLTGTEHADQLTGNKLANRLTGAEGDDSLNGAAGNDSLYGGDGDDVLNGGAGNDLAQGNSGDDRFMQDTLAGDDTLQGGWGADTVDYTRSTLSTADSVAVFLGRGQLDASGVKIGTAVKSQNGKIVGNDVLYDIEHAVGSIGRDTLTGSAGNNDLTGGPGNDSIDGAGGDDRIIQNNTAADTLDGGSGIDTADYSALPGLRSGFLDNLGVPRTGTGIVADMSAGVVYKFMPVANLPASVNKDLVRNIEVIVGTAAMDHIAGDDLNNKLFGGAGDDRLYGRDGNDVLDGGSGDDILSGGAGDDILNGGSGSNVINGGSGNDTLRMDEGKADQLIFDADFGHDRVFAVATGVPTGASTIPSGVGQGLPSSPPVPTGSAAVVHFSTAAAADVLFQRQGDDLRVTLASAADELTLVNWYGMSIDSGGNAPLHLAQFEAGDLILGHAVLDEFVTISGAAPKSMEALWNSIN